MSRFRFLVSPVPHKVSMKKMGIITDRVVNVGGFAEPQREFLRLNQVLLERAENETFGNTFRIFSRFDFYRKNETYPLSLCLLWKNCPKSPFIALHRHDGKR